MHGWPNGWAEISREGGGRRGLTSSVSCAPQIGLPNQAQREAILQGYIRRHHLEIGEQGVSKALLNNTPGERRVGDEF